MSTLLVLPGDGIGPEVIEQVRRVAGRLTPDLTILERLFGGASYDLHGEPLGKYFIHGLGHGVGIDVHDPSDYTKAFDVGSVFTIEPGIYIPEERIGVRIEDTFYVDASGKLIDFAEKLPRTAEEVEAAMR